MGVSGIPFQTHIDTIVGLSKIGGPKFKAVLVRTMMISHGIGEWGILCLDKPKFGAFKHDFEDRRLGISSDAVGLFGC